MQKCYLHKIHSIKQSINEVFLTNVRSIVVSCVCYSQSYIIGHGGIHRSIALSQNTENVFLSAKRLQLNVENFS